jgi:hypothetical protein
MAISTRSRAFFKEKRAAFSDGSRVSVGIAFPDCTINFYGYYEVSFA